MKYGLVYYKATDNIGDDIQTYVAIKYLPHIDYYIDRESLSCFIPREKEYVSMIMNGWYIHNKIAWPPSPYINPLLISMHFKESNETDVGDIYLREYGGEFLKKYGPVGARDIDTQKRLIKNGIDSYFSGCMTLTLEKFENVEKKNKICIVDMNDNVIEKIKKNTDCDIEFLSHFLNQKETETKPIDERMNNVENLLKKYQEAHLVITTRLHVALPCVALGTPVILIHKEFYDKDRLGVFLEYFDNYIEEDFLNMDIKEILRNPKPNSDKYINIKDLIDKKCREFIQVCEKGEVFGNVENECTKSLKSEIELKINLNNENLPDIKEYKKYVKNIMWYKDLYEKERLALENAEQKRVKEFEIYHNELETLNKQRELLLEYQNSLKIELNKSQDNNIRLNQELSQIYNSRGWKCLEKIRRFYKK